MMTSKLSAVSICGMALAAALLFAPDRARADDECGTVSSSATTASCTDATYSDGISYPDVGHAITLELLGSTTPTTVTIGRAGGDPRGDAHGVWVGTTSPGGDIAVIIGGETSGTAHVVRIAEENPPGGRDGNGVVVAASARATVDLKSGVAIGAQDAPVREDGISVGASGTAAITNAATIHALDEGISAGGTRGNVFVTNSGDITAGTWGIRSLMIGRGGVSGDLSVTNSGGDVLGTYYSGIAAFNIPYEPHQDNDGDVTVSVTGGTVRSTAQWGVPQYVPELGRGAIYAATGGAGDVTVSVSDGAALVSRHDAGVFASLGYDVGNLAAASASYAADNRVKITQGGEILGRTGVLAQATASSAAATVMRRAPTAQPVIDIDWMGKFSHGEAPSVAQNDDDRFRTLGSGAYTVLLMAQEVVAEKTIRYGSPAGIEAQVISWREVTSVVAKGDDPGMIADTGAQTMAVPTGATASDNAYVAQLRTALENGEIDIHSNVLTSIGSTATTADGVTDAEIVRHLQEDDAGRRAVLRNMLAQSLSDEEKAVLRAVVAGDRAGLTAALNDADAGFSDAYKTAVRALLDRYNVGDIRIAMNGGSIDSRGDGIRAYYATPHANNGTIDVTVAEGASITGAAAGVYVANAGLGDVGEDAPRGRSLLLKSEVEDLRQQFVTVHGTVTGGTDAAVHLAGGGALIVGRTGQVLAGSSGRAILVNDPGEAIIVIEGTVRGGANGRAAVDMTGGGMVTVGLEGSVNANGATNAIRAAGGKTDVILVTVAHRADSRGRPYREDADAAAARVNGLMAGDGIEKVTYVRGATGMGTDVPLKNGRPDNSGLESATPRMICDRALDERCRLYEALPSALLAMNGLPTYAERASAARDARGGWARVEAANGKWKAEDSKRPNVAYDHRRYGLRAGMDFLADETVRLGLSAHGLRGSAEMASVGEADMTGSGMGVHATTFVGGFHVDVQAAATWYDMDLKSRSGKLKDGVNGRGYAAGVEAGKRAPTAADGVFLTPRAGLSWSKVALDAFTEEMTAGAARVSVEDAESLKGRAGVAVEKMLNGGADGSLFGSLDVEREFSEETEAKVSGTALRATAEKTRFRFALGGDVRWGDGRYALRSVMNYTAGGGGNRDFGAGLNFAVRF